jgi:uncharacterized protein (TIGR02145 family)
MKKFLFIVCIVSFCLFVGCPDKSSNPINNNIADSVKICNQVWMTKNLNVDHYRNGDSIPEVRDSTEWSNLTTGAWCYYNNDPVMGKIYGKLYNWFAVNDQRGLAPLGWHIPSDTEWVELELCLGGDNVAGVKMKEAGTSHWQSPNTGATNSSGFSALPGGYRNGFGDRNGSGICYFIGDFGYWWSSTEHFATYAWLRGLSCGYSNIFKSYDHKESGFSVRCIKDN